MSDAEKQLAGFLTIVLTAARQAIKTVESDVFDDTDAELEDIINRLAPGGTVC
jgi:hypothetical protein